MSGIQRLHESRLKTYGNIEIETDCYSLISDYDRAAKMTQGSERSCSDNRGTSVRRKLKTVYDY